MSDTITIDLDIYRWPFIDRMDFEKVAGMTVERAAKTLADAAGNEDVALDVPARVQAAFVWIAARKTEPGLTFDTAAARFDGEAFFDAIHEEDDAPPLATTNRAQRRSTGKSSARSATTSTTRPRKSAN